MPKMKFNMIRSKGRKVKRSKGAPSFLLFDLSAFRSPIRAIYGKEFGAEWQVRGKFVPGARREPVRVEA
jgi:hypothetical protein